MRQRPSMSYFKLPRILEIGRQIRTGAQAAAHDAAVVQHLYLGAPLDLSMPEVLDSIQTARSTPGKWRTEK
jgi:hypothetical protein